jgi:hypothetical protein
VWRWGCNRAFVGAALMTVASVTVGYAGTCNLPAWNSTAGPGSPMPAAVHAHAATSAAGFIYAISGSDTPPPGGGNVNLIQRYDQGTNTWSMNFATVPVPVGGASLAYDAAGVGDGPRLFLFGGAPASGTPGTQVQVYTLSTNAWTPGLPLPAPRAGMASGVFGGVVYLVGGLNAAGVAQSQTWEFNFASGTYNTALAPMPSAKARAGSAVSGGRLYAISGRDAAGNLVDTNYEYTPPPTDAWMSRAVIPTMVAAPGATVLGAMTAECNGDIVVVGGGTPFDADKATPDGPRAPDSTNAVQLYDLASDTWSSGPSLPIGRFALRAAQAGDTLIAFGGWDGSSTVTTVDRIQGPPLPVELQGFRVE